MKNSLNRKEFIRKSAIMSAAIAFLPRFVFAKTPTTVFSPSPDFVASTFTIDPNAIIDLHCHPSLKMYMLGKEMWLRHLLRSAGANEVHMQEDTYEFSFGYVRGVLATHYLPEGGIEKEWGSIKPLWPLIKKLAFRTADKMEHQDYSNFTQINIMIDTLESQVHVANDKLLEAGSPMRFVIARNHKEFSEAMSRPDRLTNTIPIAHSIEGAHALGRNLVRSPKKIEEKRKENIKLLPGEGQMILEGQDRATLYNRNLEALHKRGVCLITLSHFFKNDISYPVEGISPEQKKPLKMGWSYNPAKMNCPLTDIGVEVVKKMFDLGVIVDLTHSTPAVRDNVYEINRQRPKEQKLPRPVVFTHTGSQAIFNQHDNNSNFNFGFYGVRQEDIDAIYEFDGVIGVIPEIFWLAGSNQRPEIDGKIPADARAGIPYMIETLKAINKAMPVADFKHIAIGTDFDGLANNPPDLYLNEQLNGLYRAIQEDEELGKDDRIALITYQNSLRVLKNGWGNSFEEK